MRNYSKDYPGFVNAPDAAYPQGSPKNATTDTAEDGTPVEQGWVADQWGFMQSVMHEAGDTPNEQSESVSNPQVLTALKKITKKEIQNTAYTENRFKGNQNPVVKGKDGHPLPDSTKRNYPAGDEIAAGIIALTNVVNLTYVNGVYSADSGIMRRLYTKDTAGLITKTSQYGCLKLTDGSQLQALVDDIATNGSRITEVGNDVAVDGDLAVTDFRFIGLSDERGALADVNDEESIYLANIKNSGLAGNYEEILSVGNYTSGTYTYPNGHTEDDYSKIELMVSQADVLFYGSSTMYSEMINQPWQNHRVQSTAGEFAQMTRQSSTSFSVSIGGGLGVKMIVGYLKEGVV